MVPRDSDDSQEIEARQTVANGNQAPGGHADRLGVSTSRPVISNGDCRSSRPATTTSAPSL